MLLMFFNSAAVNKNVINVYKHTLVKEVEEELIHGALEGGRCVAQPKRHHRELKLPISRHKGSLRCVIRVHGYLVVSITQVKFTKNACSLQTMQQIIYTW